jgi:hypothetical protein
MLGLWLGFTTPPATVQSYCMNVVTMYTVGGMQCPDVYGGAECSM